MKYSELFKYRIYIVFLLVSSPISYMLGQDTFLDTFSVIAYNQNNGNQDWGTNWIESGDDGNANNNGTFNARRIYINNGQLNFNQNQLFFIDLDGATIERGLNLSSYNAAKLTLDFDSRFRGTETLVIEFFNSTTGLYETADIINTTEISSLEYNLTAEQISASSRIRFSSGSGNWPNNQGIFIDNIQIEAFESTITVNDVTVNESAGTITITATYTGPFFLGIETVDFTTADVSALAGLDYTTTSGTLTFNTFDRTETITVPIINNSFAEPDETFTINLSNVSDNDIAIFDGIETIIDDPDDIVIAVNTPLTLFEEFNGYYDYASTGGSFRDNETNTCSIVNSSSNTLTSPILTGGVIERAYLVWTHSGINADDVVTFEGQQVTANFINQSTIGTAFSFFSMMSDVTDIINDSSIIADPSTNTYTVSNLNIDNNNPYCSSNVTLGGWSLFVFYTEPNLPAVSINMYQGFQGQQNTTTEYTLDGFFAIGSLGSKTTVLSWEGDTGLANNELLSIETGTGTFTLSGDGDNNGVTTNNPFNSTIYDNTVTPIVNQEHFGLDLDTYDISPYITQGESSATTQVGVGGDYVMLNAVLLKVPSNLITGTVFEDVNYGGGQGRDFTTSSGIGLEGVTVELYNSLGILLSSDITDENGNYVMAGMANGSYRIRVVNNTVKSSRNGGSTCTTCLPIQTYKTEYSLNTLTPVTNEVGGNNPSGQDTSSGVINNAQTVSTVTILNEGVVGIDFGFNFNSIVNTNEGGQGSLEQFIINSNSLDEVGLNIEANSIFNPATGEDVSIFMIPTTSDPLGRTADARFNGSGYFDILISNSAELSSITDDNTHIDGRTQTAYSGDTNTGTVGTSNTIVGVTGNTLSNYNQPEIQIRQNNGVDNYVLNIEANEVVVRNTAIYSNIDSGIQMTSGSSTIIENLIGINANGGFVQNIDYGIEILGGTTVIDSNYIADNTEAGILINGGISSIIKNNQITQNGLGTCGSNILINSGTGILIDKNLIELSEAVGIKDNTGGVTISENTIINSGKETTCTELSGISLTKNNTIINNNIINNNSGAGIVLTGGNTTGNLISQNSIYANGTFTDAIGIDINNDGVSINDNGDNDNGPNETINFPVFETIFISGSNIVATGWSIPGATIELFLTDVNQGTANLGDNKLTLVQDYGEGQLFLASVVEGSINDTNNGSSEYLDVDGNTDNTEKFSFKIPLTNAIPVGSIITATATLSGSTSEFGGVVMAKAYNVITNRNITYRVKKQQ